VEKNLMIIANSIIAKQTLTEIEQINEETLQYGLKLSEKDIKTIIETRNVALKSYGRAEFGVGIITKLISAFSDSPYIFQSNYVEMIDDLIETFYYFKNETMDEFSDDDLIKFMKEYFDNKCQGDLDLLREKYLDRLVYNIKHGVDDYLDVDDEMDLDGEGDEDLDEGYYY
jgi:uncharacterized protein YbcC (UPF0753/DUF2309 family)